MKVKLNRHHKYEINFAYSSDCPEWKWKIQRVINATWNKLVYFCVRDVIKLDAADSWSCDYTLAKIAYPLLIQLKETNHGYGFIDDEDVPEELRTDNGEPIDYANEDDSSGRKEKFVWFMDEIIWTMKELGNYEDESPDFPKDVPLFMSKSKRTPEQDEKVAAWMAEMQAHEGRLQNGCRLFGKYFRNLWD